MPAFPSRKRSSSVLSKPGNFTPTVGRQTTAKKRIGKFVTGLVLTLRLCPKFGSTMIRPLIQTSGFLTELGDVFADPAFPPTKRRSATPSKLGSFRQADAPATLVHKPTPNFAVGLALIPTPCPRSVRSVPCRILKIQARIEFSDNETGVSLQEHRASCPLRRDQRTVCCASRAAGRPCPPVDPPASASQTARSSRASIRRMPHGRRASVWGSAAGVALRLRFAMRFSPLSAPLSPLAERRPNPVVDDRLHAHADRIITQFGGACELLGADSFDRVFRMNADPSCYAMHENRSHKRRAADQRAAHIDCNHARQAAKCSLQCFSLKARTAELDTAIERQNHVRHWA